MFATFRKFVYVSFAAVSFLGASEKTSVFSSSHEPKLVSEHDIGVAEYLYNALKTGELVKYEEGADVTVHREQYRITQKECDSNLTMCPARGIHVACRHQEQRFKLKKVKQQYPCATQGRILTEEERNPREILADSTWQVAGKVQVPETRGMGEEPCPHIGGVLLPTGRMGWIKFPINGMLGYGQYKTTESNDRASDLCL